MAFDAFALMLAMLVLGKVLARARLLPGNASDVLNLVVLYVCLPAAVLIHMPRLRLDPALLGVVATPWLLAVISVGLVTACSRWLKFRRDEFAVVLLCVALGNTGYIGYPMVQALLGDQALPYAVVYDQLGTFLLLSTFGLYVVAKYSGDAPPKAREVTIRLLRFPPIWALLLGMTIMPEHPPNWLAVMLQRLSDALLPLVMLAVGLSIQLRLPRDELKPLVTGLLLKLVVMPGIALVITAVFGMQGAMRSATVLEASMPAMVSAAALASVHGLAPRLSSALVAYGILLSLLILPAWALLLRLLP